MHVLVEHALGFIALHLLQDDIQLKILFDIDFRHAICSSMHLQFVAVPMLVEGSKDDVVIVIGWQLHAVAFMVDPLHIGHFCFPKIQPLTQCSKETLPKSSL